MTVPINKPEIPVHWLTHYTFNDADTSALKCQITELLDTGYESSAVDTDIVLKAIDEWVNKIKERQR